MYELITLGYDGRYFEKILKDIVRVEHAAGFVRFISNENQCMYGINADKLVSYRGLCD